MTSFIDQKRPSSASPCLRCACCRTASEPATDTEGQGAQPPAEIGTQPRVNGSVSKRSIDFWLSQPGKAVVIRWGNERELGSTGRDPAGVGAAVGERITGCRERSCAEGKEVEIQVVQPWKPCTRRFEDFQLRDQRGGGLDSTGTGSLEILRWGAPLCCRGNWGGRRAGSLNSQTWGTWMGTRARGATHATATDRPTDDLRSQAHWSGYAWQLSAWNLVGTGREGDLKECSSTADWPMFLSGNLT